MYCSVMPHGIHYDDVKMGTIASQITSLTIVYSTDCSGAYQSKHQSSASLAFVRGIHHGPVNSPHKWPVTRRMCPFDDVIMKKLGQTQLICWQNLGCIIAKNRHLFFIDFIHPCEKVMGLFFQNHIWARCQGIDRLCLMCVKRFTGKVEQC